VAEVLRELEDLAAMVRVVLHQVDEHVDEASRHARDTRAPTRERMESVTVAALSTVQRTTSLPSWSRRFAPIMASTSARERGGGACPAV